MLEDKTTTDSVGDRGEDRFETVKKHNCKRKLPKAESELLFIAAIINIEKEVYNSFRTIRLLSLA